MIETGYNLSSVYLNPDVIITTYHDVGLIVLAVGLACLATGYLAACRHYGRI